MANSDVQPWTPDPSHGPGEPGERGTNAFPGTSNFNADGTRTGGYMGPRGGVSYHPDGVALDTAVPAHVSPSHVGAETVTVAVNASNNAPVHGTSVTLTATITPSAAEEPTGTVTFKDGSTTLGTAKLTAPGDTATYTVTAGFTAGTHPITAVFSGDGNYGTATSPAHNVVAS